MIKQIIASLLVIILSNGPALAQIDSRLSNADSTKALPHATIYLVRHAEKDTQYQDNPPLTLKGVQRARRLKTILRNEIISAVYSTETKRTLDTAAPIAASSDVSINTYTVGELSRARFLQDYKGKSIVIVGHSNTIPKLVNKLLGIQRYPDLLESEYDDLFIVHLFSDHTSAHRLLLPL